jgi:GTPase Era involved in 16S rRNA processing
MTYDNNSFELEELRSIFLEVTSKLKAIGDLVSSPLSDIRVLEDEIDMPCKVAISGKVSAGKSTLVNALLGVEIATVGANETTAALTFFKHTKFGPENNITLNYKGGRKELLNLRELNQIQGVDVEVINKLKDVDYIEAFVDSPILKSITIIDTPGSGSVESSHEESTRSLFESRIEQSKKITDGADAVLYLFSFNPDLHNQESLDYMRRELKSTSDNTNIIGIITKSDISENVLLNPNIFADKMLDQFLGVIQTVVPVSVKLHELVVTKSKDQVKSFKNLLITIPPNDFPKITINHRLFVLGLKKHKDQILVCEADLMDFFEMNWEEIQKDWGFVRLVMNLLFDNKEDDSLEELVKLSGFKTLIQAFDTHIVKRTGVIKGQKVASQLRKILIRMYNKDLYRLADEEQKLIEKRENYISFLKKLKHSTAQDLLNFIKKNVELSTPESKRVLWINETILRLEVLLLRFKRINSDFLANDLLAKSFDIMVDIDFKELQVLFSSLDGVKGKSVYLALSEYGFSNLYHRRNYWDDKSKTSRRTSPVHRLANLAVDKYTELINIRDEK